MCAGGAATDFVSRVWKVRWYDKCLRRRSRQVRNMTEEEGEYAERAFAEFREKGSSTLACPVCGGPFLFHDSPSGYSVTCQNSACDFRYTVRGI